MKNPDENQTPEEIQKTIEEVFFNESESQKSKMKSEGKPGPKSEEEKQAETVINNI